MHKLAYTGLVLLAASRAALGQTPAITETPVVVADVIVQGSDKIATPTALTYVKTRRGANYNPDIVQEDTRDLVASKLFADVRRAGADVGRAPRAGGFPRARLAQ